VLSLKCDHYLLVAYWEIFVGVEFLFLVDLGGLMGGGAAADSNLRGDEIPRR